MVRHDALLSIRHTVDFLNLSIPHLEPPCLTFCPLLLGHAGNFGNFVDIDTILKNDKVCQVD